jgi:acyl-CoA synthetase (AMP-forming)/AMP-acid ligase II
MIKINQLAHEYDSAWPQFSLETIIRDHAARHPDKPAVIDGQRDVTISYRELVEQGDRLAAALAARGVSQGDTVAVQLPNWWEFVPLYLALTRLGAVICPVAPAYRKFELSHIIATADVRAIVVPGQYRGRDYVAQVAESLREIGREPGSLACVYAGEAPRDVPGWAEPLADLLADTTSELPPRPEIDLDAAHMILFTSGTESRPKAVVHTHNTSNYSLTICSPLWGMDGDHVVLVAAPVSHGTGFHWCCRIGLFQGSTLVMMESWSAEEAARLIRTFGCSFTYAPTRFLQDLLDYARTLPEGERFAFDTFASGGSPIPRQYVQDALELMSCKLLATYGMTECFVATSTRLTDAAGKIASTDGKQIADPVQVEIVDGEMRPVPYGEPGVLRTRGPHVAAGYLDPTGQVNPFGENGWLWTGDQCVMDDSGYIRVVGRVKEIIIRNGRNISPAEIEEQLLKSPAVAAACVVGLPDELTGERVVAAVVLRDGGQFTSEDMAGRLRESGMASFKFPERLFVVDSLPHSAVGKLQRNILRDQLVSGE